ncbi:metallophosphoesterase [Candidatus Woesearchaeota archaeon]|nr:metallophosphoesterase [Candidatus Woesearchaeota archaeon]
MKLLAFTDLHESEKNFLKLREKAANADLIVCAGDFSIFEHGYKKMIAKLDSLGKEMLVIPGNHESAKDLEHACKGTKHLTSIHGKIKLVLPYLFVGFGEGGFAVNDPDFEHFWKKSFGTIENLRKQLPGIKVVLLTHGPPFGTKLDDLGGSHAGCKSYTEFIKKVKPDAAISGHLHENAGKEDFLGKTKLFNPGPSGKYILI